MREREGQGTPGWRELRQEINISTAGDNILITGSAGLKIRVYMVCYWAQAANTVIMKDGATSINGAGFNFAAQAGGVFDFPNRPLTLTAGNNFVLNLSANQPLTGWIEYTQAA